VRFELVAEEFRVADDDGQEIVEIVRDAAGELADHLHLLRLHKLFFSFLAFGKVVDDPDEDGFAILPRLANRQLHSEPPSHIVAQGPSRA